jgi:hypothetical protein
MISIHQRLLFARVENIVGASLRDAIPLAERAVYGDGSFGLPTSDA